MNRFDEVLIVNPGAPDGEGERSMYGYYGEPPMYYGYGGYGNPYAEYAEYPEQVGYYGYAEYPDPYAGLGAPYGYAEVDPGLYGYGQVDPGYYGYGQVDPSLYGYGYGEADAPELAEYGWYGEDPYAYGNVDPYGYGEPEMVGWGQADTITMDEDPSTYYAEVDPELGAYVRDMHPAPGNAVCPIVGSVLSGPDDLGAYVAPSPVGPTCGSFTPQPGTPPPVPDTFKPLW